MEQDNTNKNTEIASEPHTVETTVRLPRMEQRTPTVRLYPSTVRVMPQKDPLRCGHVNIPPDNANLLAWLGGRNFFGIS